ncbi:MAG: hypothetical protein AAB364_00525 [Patescibacteria group bacterium]
MIKNLTFPVSLLVMALLLVGIPAFSQAATFAYVSQSGYVQTVIADNASAALFNNGAIDNRSGVMLLDNLADYAIVGYYVYGL